VDKVAKEKSKSTKNIKIKSDEIPTLKSPTETLLGKIVIWIVLIAMVGGVLAGLIYAIVAGNI
jgi:hypothetical protein